MKSRLASLFALAALLGTTHAAMVLVDFSSNGGGTPGGLQGGNHWNTIDTITTENLLDAGTGLDSGWDINVSFAAGSVGYGGPAINGNGDAAPFDQSFAIINGIFSNRVAGVATIAFTNLAANTQYDFSTYSDRAGGWANSVISTTVGTGPASVALLKDTVTDFSITSDGSGALTFTFVEGPGESANLGDNSVLNALSMTQVPEPSAAVLSLFAGLGLLVRRRR